MKDIKTLLKTSRPGTEASSQTSPIAAGRTDTRSAAREDELIDAINQVFTLFRLNFHNQYHAAFGDTDFLNQAKRLWKEALQDFEPQIILKATRRIIEDSEYLPTLQKMLSACTSELAEYGIPDMRSAYQEAANAASPKNAQKWSHPIVYLAGKSVGWYAMSHQSEQATYPRFATAYKALIKQYLSGEQLEIDQPKQIGDGSTSRASQETVLRELSAIRKLLEE
jgi:Replication protein P